MLESCGLVIQDNNINMPNKKELEGNSNNVSLRIHYRVTEIGKDFINYCIDKDLLDIDKVDEIIDEKYPKNPSRPLAFNFF